MATTKLKSRTNNKINSQFTQFKFRWWMVLILVGVVAIIGIVIVQYSRAATDASYTKVYADKIVSVDQPNSTQRMTLQSSGTWTKQGRFNAKSVRWQRRGDNKCATITRYGAGKDRFGYLNGSYADFYKGSWVEVGETNNCY